MKKSIKVVVLSLFAVIFAFNVSFAQDKAKQIDELISKYNQ